MAVPPVQGWWPTGRARGARRRRWWRHAGVPTQRQARGVARPAGARAGRLEVVRPASGCPVRQARCYKRPTTHEGQWRTGASWREAPRMGLVFKPAATRYGWPASNRWLSMVRAAGFKCTWAGGFPWRPAASSVAGRLASRRRGGQRAMRGEARPCRSRCLFFLALDGAEPKAARGNQAGSTSPTGLRGGHVVWRGTGFGWLVACGRFKVTSCGGEPILGGRRPTVVRL